MNASYQNVAAPSPNLPSQSSSIGLIFTAIFIIAGLIIIYYLYKYLYTGSHSSSTTLINGPTSAAIVPTLPPNYPKPLEGGEYTVNTWVYLSSFIKNMNARKHLIEIKGKNFSTLVVAIGAFKNSLTVRTFGSDVTNTNVVTRGHGGAGGAGGAGAAGAAGSRHSGSAGTRRNGIVEPPGSYWSNGSWKESFTDSTGNTPRTAPLNRGNTAIEPFSTATPNSCTSTTTLYAADVKSLFQPMAMDDCILKGPPPECDIQEIDLQRWVMISIVLSGRTVDVYIDGKLRRSCASSTYYQVDPTGVSITMLENGGFDGYVGNTNVAGSAMNPDEIYSMYLSGPGGSSYNILSWFASVFKGPGSA